MHKTQWCRTHFWDGPVIPENPKCSQSTAYGNTGLKHAELQQKYSGDDLIMHLISWLWYLWPSDDALSDLTGITWQRGWASFPSHALGLWLPICLLSIALYKSGAGGRESCMLWREPHSISLWPCSFNKWKWFSKRKLNTSPLMKISGHFP